WDTPVVSYLLRLLALSGALSVEELVLYDDRYRRSVASLVAASPDRSVRDCFVNDAYPTLLAEFSFTRSRAVPRDSVSHQANKQGSKSGICYAFRDGNCRFGNNCRFRHSGGSKKAPGDSESAAGGRSKPSGEPQRKAGDKEDKKASSDHGERPRCSTATDHVSWLQQRAVEAVEQSDASTGYQDGTGLGATRPSAFSAEVCPIGVAEVTKILLEEASSLEANGCLRDLAGSPSPEQVKELERSFQSAADSVVPKLCAALGCSDRLSACGSPIRAELGEALAVATNDPDSNLFVEINQGLNLGVNPPVPPTGVYPAAKSKKHLDKSMEVFNLKRAYRNFSSVELQPEVCRVILHREVALGRMRRLSVAQAAHAAHRLYAKMALIPKGDQEYRLIEDHSRSGLNGLCKLSETCSLPRSRDIRTGLSDLLHGDSTSTPCPCGRDGAGKGPYDYIFLKYDVASAYRHLFLREEDRARTSARLGQDVYENLALPFGAGTSPFHWCRTSAALCRIVASLLRCAFGHAKFLSLIYVDDGLLALPKPYYVVGSILALLVWRCLNFDINWGKCQFGVRAVKFIGYEATLLPGGEAEVGVHPDIFSSIRDILLSFVDEKRVTPAPLSKVLGKLVFASQGMRHLKGFLQPLYALLNVFEKKHLRSIKLKPSSRTFGSVLFWLGIAENPLCRSRVSSPRSVAGRLVVASDASTEFMGGWASDGTRGLWFQLEANSGSLGEWAKLLSDASPVGVPTHRDIALLELVAAVVSLHLAASLTPWDSSLSTVPGSESYPCQTVVLFCDNAGIVGVLKKLYSPKPALAAILRGVAHWFGRLTDRLVLAHVSSTENWLADNISRDILAGVPSHWRRATLELNDVLTSGNLGPGALEPSSGQPLSLRSKSITSTPVGVRRSGGNPVCCASQQVAVASRFRSMSGEGVGPLVPSRSKRAMVRDFLGQFDREEATALADSFASTGLASSTNSLYDSTVVFFEEVIGGKAFPLRVQDLSLLVWALTSCSYAYNSISTFVSALRSRNKSAGFWLTPGEDFQVGHILKAARKATGGHPVRKMRPITRSELLELFRNAPPRKDVTSRAMLVGIFALLRADELLNLRWGDLSFSQGVGTSSTPLLSIRVRRSKTDQCGAGQLAYIACFAEAVRAFEIKDMASDPCELCPVHAVLATKPFACDWAPLSGTKP
ncbi:hypothetical protein FOZ63_026629, partial [Perkinsus olseni]